MYILNVKIKIFSVTFNKQTCFYIFSINREDYMLDYSSEEETEEEEDVEFNRLMSGGNTTSVHNLNDSSQLNQSSGNIYQKFKSKTKDKQFTSKLAKKSNRLIRSMQNLANFRSRSRSRSNSADSMTSNETTSASKNGGKSSKKSSKNDLSGTGDDSKDYSSGGGGGKSDLIKSLFVSVNFSTEI